MSIQFWSTVRPRTGNVSYGFDIHSDEHVISLISPNAREVVERGEKGVNLYTRGPRTRFLSVTVCQLRVAESPITAERFLPCSFYWGERSSDVASTVRRSALTMRQFAVQNIGLPPCFDWWINRGTCSLPLSLVIKADKALVNLPPDRYGDSLLSLNLDGQTALHIIQTGGPLTSVRTLWLTRVEKVTPDDLHRFPNIARLYLRNVLIDMSGTRADLVGSQTPGGTNVLPPCEHLQHLFIHDCFRVCMSELPMLFPHLRSLSLRGSNLGSPLHFPPEMPQLTHLDLLVQNPERIGQLPHSPNLRFLALKDLDIAVLRTVLGRTPSLRHLEGRINSVESFHTSSLGTYVYLLEELRINDSPQLRNLTFPQRDSLLHLRSLDINGNSQLITLDISGCVNLTELACCSCSQLREVVGLTGQGNLETLHVHENPQLTTLDVSGCVNLTDLSYHKCPRLSEVVGLQGLSKLQVLRAGGGDTMTMLDVSGYKNLRQLFCEACPQPRELVGLAGPHSLCVLHVVQNPHLVTLDVSGCVSLEKLSCDGCSALTEIIGLAGLEKLEKLTAYKNPKLTGLDVGGCVNLRWLSWWECGAFTEIVGLASLMQLENLFSVKNAKLKTLNVSGCTSLRCLWCYECVGLTEIVGLSDQEILQDLRAYENPRLTSLDVSGCVSLNRFDCYGCGALTGIVGLSGLGKLEILQAHRNPNLTSLDVTGCVRLKEFNFDRCPQLRHIVGLDGIPALKQSVLTKIAHAVSNFCSLQ